MVNAIVLIRCERGTVNEVAETLAALPAISEVYSVGGRFDLVAIIRAKENDALADVVTKEISSTPGIASTETMVAFRAYSRHDLEAAFSLGTE